jgi:hypothetical protein
MTPSLRQDIDALMEGVKESLQISGEVRVFDAADGRLTPLSAEDERKLDTLFEETQQAGAQ